MNLFRLHTDPSQLLGADFIPAQEIMNLVPEREQALEETGEILNAEMQALMKGMTPNADVENYLLTGNYTEDLILTYAGHVMKKRWPEGEEIIKDEAYTARRYAMMFNFRFKEAEPEIAKWPEQAYYYAVDVINGRWPEAEKYMKQNDDVWYEYCEQFGLDYEA